MLNSIGIENFKAFGEMQKIPLKPITLLFGPNSSGKSSIIHSLLMESEARRTATFDVDNTQLSGFAIDLGGFNQFVFKRNKKSNVKLALEFDIKEYNLSQAKSAKLVFEIGFQSASIKKTPQIPLLKSYEMIVDDEQLIKFNRNKENNFDVTKLNSNHHFFKQKEGKNGFRIGDKLINHKKISVSMYRLYDTELDWGNILEESTKKLLEEYDGKNVEEREYLNTYLNRINDISNSQLQFFNLQVFVDELEKIAAEILRKFQYLGPLRSIPPRHTAFIENQDPNWLGGGGNAWLKILNDEEIREQINKWLGDDKLETKYRMEVHNFVSEEQAQNQKLTDNSNVQNFLELSMTDLRTNTLVSPRDIGVGISQVIPVLVYAFGSENNLIAIEQPELHLHPALQSELGDVFIESAIGGNSNKFILETHSEHLMLRILRRIRESNLKTDSKNKIKLTPNDVAVIYLVPKPDGVKIMELPISSEGKFEFDWPNGFFEERLKELFGDDI